MNIGQFLDSLEALGILSQDELRVLRSEQASDGQDARGAKRLSARLVSQGKLTRFQAKMIYRGKGHRLVCGQYLLRERLALGGMGKAYRAVARDSQQAVGIKVIASRSLQSRRAIRDFRQDVLVASALAHPNIVATHEMGIARGLPYLVVEDIEGVTLAKHIKRKGPLAVEVAIRFLTDVARGLEYAHSQHVIHRDIRPANLLLSGDGVVRILDLGLARPERPLVEPLTGERSSRAEEAVRDIDFMAPELTADLSSGDRRSDVYSLGCTLYYLLIGNRMYHGQPVVERLLAHRQAPVPSLPMLRTDVPLSVDMLFQRMVAKDPGRRYQTMTATREALEQCLNPELALPPVVPESVVASEQLSELPVLSAPQVSSAPPVVSAPITVPPATAPPTLVPPITIPPPIQSPPPATPPALFVPPRPPPIIDGPRPYPAVPPQQGCDERSPRPWWALGVLLTCLFLLVLTIQPPVNSPPSASTEMPSEPATAETRSEEALASIPEAAATVRPAQSPAPVMKPKANRQKPDRPSVAKRVARNVSLPPPVSPVPQKSAVPDAEIANQAIQQVRETYQADLEKAQSPWRKKELAKELLEDIKGPRNSPEKIYGMLHLARRLAIEGGSAEVACQAIDLMAGRFEIDYLAEKTDGLVAIARGLPTLDSTERNVLVDRLLEQARAIVQQQIDADRYDLARTLTEQMLKTCKAQLDGTFARPWSELAQRIDEQQKFYSEKYLPAVNVLQQNDDGIARSDVGCFHCFYKGDWDRGLPDLRRGALTTWRRLAEQEMRGPTSVDDRLWLAAGWWEAASISPPFARQQIKRHAGGWYQRALPRMSAGDARDAVEAKLRELRLDANSAAIARGIRWLVERQLDEGSWTFKSDPNGGSFNNQMAATAMALRVLLESSVDDGKCQSAIRNGLEYLRKRGKDGDYRGATEPQSNMYVQAMATIALAQGYAYTKDSKLRKEAQQAVQFILAAQDPKSGGWRYLPRESPGDLSSTGWQIVALDMAKRCGIDANYAIAMRGVGYFLDSVTADDGVRFFYNQETPTPNQRLTAVGLTCRTLTRNRIIDVKNAGSRTTFNGARQIAQFGPSANDAYFNYYATELLSMKGDDDWHSWRQQMANTLLNTQEKGEGVDGSWFAGWTGTDADAGSKLLPDGAGRLGITALCLLMLLDCNSH